MHREAHFYLYSRLVIISPKGLGQSNNALKLYKYFTPYTSLTSFHFSVKNAYESGGYDRAIFAVMYFVNKQKLIPINHLPSSNRAIILSIFNLSASAIPKIIGSATQMLYNVPGFKY